MKLNRIRTSVCAIVMLSSCSGAYYSAMEKLGYEKREIMASRVQEAKQSQHEAKEQFKNALEQFNTVLNKKGGGKLEEKYELLSSELERSETKANKVRNKIASVEDVSDALFKEWERELAQYKNQTLRAKSSVKLSLAEQRYETMILAMKRAESKLDPALQPLRDDVLFLKHNLNAEAIGSLASDLSEVETNVALLIHDLEVAIAEADTFMGELEQNQS